MRLKKRVKIILGVAVIGFGFVYYVYTQLHTHNNDEVMKQEFVMELNLRNTDVQLTKGCTYQSHYNIKSIKDEKGKTLTYSNVLSEGTYIVEDNLDCSVAGEYNAKIIAMNQSGQTMEKSFKITVHDDAIGYKAARTQEIEPTYIDGILLVNKQHPLPADFKEDGASAYQALHHLQAAAEVEGFSLPLLSGYRSYDYQVDLYQSYVDVDGVENADQYSARPGYSEHQSGLCFDVGEISYTYGDTQQGQWLAKHCAEYGFIIRYPKGKEHITGYTYEPWHIRYVGKEIATFIMNEGITLEEYLGAR